MIKIEYKFGGESGSFDDFDDFDGFDDIDDLKYKIINFTLSKLGKSEEYPRMYNTKRGDSDRNIISPDRDALNAGFSKLSATIVKEEKSTTIEIIK